MKITDNLKKVKTCLRENGWKGLFVKIKNKIKCRRESVKQTRTHEKELALQRRKKFSADHKISIAVPLYNTPLKLLEEMICSVLAQTYAGWELCLADGSDAAHAYTREICVKYVQKDARIRYKKLEENTGISGNTNEALRMATGDYIALLDHDDRLHPSALFKAMEAICGQGADLIYTDEKLFENIPEDGMSAHYKPDYSPDTLRGGNYICHFSVFSRKLMEDAGGGFCSEFDGSQDFDMILRLTEKAKKIVHIPEILYYWRACSGSVAQDMTAKPYVFESARRAIACHLERMGLKGKVTDSSELSSYRIRYELEGSPLVSAIILCGKDADKVAECITALSRSTYKNLEAVLVADEKVVEDALSKIGSKVSFSVRVKKNTKSRAASFNSGAAEAKGAFYLFMDDTVRAITPAWIEEMLMFAQRPDVGAVGAMLYYPDDTVRHAGIAFDRAFHPFRVYENIRRGSVGYMGRNTVVQNWSALSDECFLISAGIFADMGGFDEKFIKSTEDADLCLRLRGMNLLLVWTPYAELYQNIKKEEEAEDMDDMAYFDEKWKDEPHYDPYYNYHLL